MRGLSSTNAHCRPTVNVTHGPATFFAVTKPTAHGTAATGTETPHEPALTNNINPEKAARPTEAARGTPPSRVELCSGALLTHPWPRASAAPPPVEPPRGRPAPPPRHSCGSKTHARAPRGAEAGRRTAPARARGPRTGPLAQRVSIKHTPLTQGEGRALGARRGASRRRREQRLGWVGVPAAVVWEGRARCWASKPH